MKKRVIAGIFAVLLAFALCGCDLIPFLPGNESSAASGSKAPESSAPSALKNSEISESSASQPSEPSPESSDASGETSEVSSSEPNESSESSLEPVSSEESSQAPSSSETQSKAEIPDWSGVYLWGTIENGELFVVEGVFDDTVCGKYVYSDELGKFGAREFAWPLDSEDPYVASELFQNGTSYIYYSLLEDGIYVDYPNGWWEDRKYEYFCSTGHEAYLEHPYYSPQVQVPHEPFYGIWTAASGDLDEAHGFADALKDAGFDAAVYITTDWSNLNPVQWYVVSAGEYPTEEAAEEMLSKVHSAGWTDAYIKYTGDYQGE